MNRPAEALFTPGPVTLPESVRQAAREPMVYHRTAAFSSTVTRCEWLLRELSGAGARERALILTASGTGAMEGTVLNLLPAGDTAIVVQGGDFGARFAEICACHGVHVRPVAVPPGASCGEEDLARVPAAGASALLITHHETSTGALHDLAAASRYCQKHGLLLIVDAIGSFLADPIDMAELRIDALIFSSQKALALPPGLSFVVLSARAIALTRSRIHRSYYFDFSRHLADLERGQTPFTPAVGLILQLEKRLEEIFAEGVDRSVARVRHLAYHFRGLLDGLPYELFAATPSNAVTALCPTDGRPATVHVAELHRRGFTVCPNGGALAEKIFRVGHLGALTTQDNLALALAMSPAASAAINH
jgi:aspartate aminotransferase-like enzyme